LKNIKDEKIGRRRIGGTEFVCLISLEIKSIQFKIDVSSRHESKLCNTPRRNESVPNCGLENFETYFFFFK